MTAAVGEDVAERAFAAYLVALERGDAGPLAARLADDAELMTTLPEDHGYGRGPRDAERIARWRFDEQRVRVRATLDGVTAGGDTWVFEVRLDGTRGGEPYTTHAAVALDLDLDGERITGLREMYGDNPLPASFFAPFGLEDAFREEAPGGGERRTGKPPTLAATRLRPADPAAQQVAQRAFDAFARSVEHGDWEPFMALLDDDVTFTLPIPARWRGVRRGAAQAREYHRWRWEDLRMRAAVTTGSRTFNGPTGAFEFAIDGTVGGGMPARHPALYVIEVARGKVVGFREYNGAERVTAP